MGKALFLSLTLHAIVVAIVVLFFKNSTLIPQQKSKSISLASIVLKKSSTPQKKSPANKVQKQKQSKIVQKTILKKLIQTATAKAADSKKVAKKIPVAKRVTKKRFVKKLIRAKSCVEYISINKKSLNVQQSQPI